jgi:hypothetical protein
MSGKWVLISVLFTASVMSATFYWALKQSPSFKGAVTQQITQEFISYATEVKGQQKLQVAQVKQVEVFERSLVEKIFWDQLQLPEVVVKITTPVEFNYSLDMKGPWEFIIHGHNLIVRPPALTPETPSPDLSATKFEVTKGNFLGREKVAMAQLQKEITPLLNQRALQNRALALEEARKSVLAK